MTFMERVLTWFEPPIMELSQHRCMECGVAAASDAAVCPECGGEVQQTDLESVPMYWGQMD